MLADVPDRLSWRGLHAIVQYAQPGTALAAVLYGEQARWGDVEYLAAIVADQARLLVWQQTKDGSKGIRQPKPLPRPGVESRGRDETKFGDASMSLAEARAWLEARNGR